MTPCQRQRSATSTRSTRPPPLSACCGRQWAMPSSTSTGRPAETAATTDRGGRLWQMTAYLWREHDARRNLGADAQDGSAARCQRGSHAQVALSAPYGAAVGWCVSDAEGEAIGLRVHNRRSEGPQQSCSSNDEGWEGRHAAAVVRQNAMPPGASRVLNYERSLIGACHVLLRGLSERERMA